MQLTKNARFKLIQLTDEINSLKAVKDKILNNKRQELLDLKDLPNGMSDDEKYYNSWWESSDQKANVVNLHLGKTGNCKATGIQYLKATPICEYATRRRKNKSGEILPKEKRLNTESFDVIFVCQNKVVYMITFTTEHHPLLRIKRLIGEQFISSETNINDLTPDLFHWLFFKYTNNKASLGNYINLENIVGFTGIVATNDHIFEGKSDQTADLIVTKAFISSGYSIKSIKIKLHSGNGILTFFVNENDDLSVERGSNIDLPLQSSEEDIAIPIFLYFIVLPELNRLYQAESESFIGTEKLKFNEEIGKMVIISIAKKNDIDLQTLSESADRAIAT